MRNAKNPRTRDLHQAKLMEAAPNMGITFEDLLPKWGLDAVIYKQDDVQKLVFDGRSYPSLSANSELICNDKQLSKQFFEMLGIPFPKSILFGISEWKKQEKVLAAFLQSGKKYVCKPLMGTDGHGVGMGLLSLAEVEAHWAPFASTYELWMLEEQAVGEDLRIQVIGGKVAAACRRLPAFVVGDGRHTLAELIQLHNEKIQQQNPFNYLEIDFACLSLMQAQSVELEDVIAKERQIQLKFVSNMGQGGLAIDVTQELHPKYYTWARLLSEAIDIRTFALDLICQDPAADPVLYASALELNPKAQWLHHTFSEVKQHDIPSLILKELFWEDKDIPFIYRKDRRGK